MGNIEEEIKQRLSGSTSSGGVDSDALWAGISAELDADSARPAGFWTGGRILGALLLVTALSSTLYMQSGPDTQPQYTARMSPANDGELSSAMAYIPAHTDAEDKVEELKSQGEELSAAESVTFNDKPSELSINNSSSTRTTSLANTGMSKTAAGQPLQTGSAQLQVETSRATVRDNEQGMLKRVQDDDYRQASNRQSLQDTSPAPRQKTSGEFMRNLPVSQNGTATDASAKFEMPGQLIDDQSAEENIRENKKALSYLAHGQVDLPALPAMGLREAKELAEYRRSTSLRPDEIAFLFGAMSTSIDYSGSGASLSNKAFASDLGFSSSLSATWKFGSGLRLGTGLELSVMRTKTDFSDQRNIEILEQDRLVYFELDTLTQAVINPQYEDVWLNAVETRTVLHHNSYTAMNVPVFVGLETSKGRFVFGADMGVTAMFMLKQSGRALDAEGELRYFDSSTSGALPYNRLELAYRLRPFVDYRLTDKLNLRVSPDIQWLAPKHSDLYRLDQETLILGLSTGLILDLN